MVCLFQVHQSLQFMHWSGTLHSTFVSQVAAFVPLHCSSLYLQLS